MQETVEGEVIETNDIQVQETPSTTETVLQTTENTGEVMSLTEGIDYTPFFLMIIALLMILTIKGVFYRG